MKDNSQYIQEAKEVNVLELVRNSHLSTQKKGKVLPCIRHDEKTASLSYNSKNNTYKCFGCGVSLSSIDFYMYLYNVDFSTAVMQMTNQDVTKPKARVIPAKHIPANIPENKPNFEVYYTFFKLLEEQPQNDNYSEIRQYFEDRHLHYCRDRYNIKYISDYKLINESLKAKYSPEMLQECGLYNEKNNLIFFKHTIITPIAIKGKIHQIQGRRHKGNDFKYLYLKAVRTMPYNADILKNTHNSKIYATEGIFDCISVIESELSNNCFALGSVSSDVKILKGILERIKRNNNTLVLLFDNDKAGNKAINTIDIDGLSLAEYCEKMNVSLSTGKAGTGKDANDSFVQEMENILNDRYNSVDDYTLEYLKKLQPDKWTPIKTEKQRCILIAAQLEFFPNIEFKNNFTHFRKS